MILAEGDLIGLASIIASFLLGACGLAFGYYQHWASRHAILREKLWEKKFEFYNELIKAISGMWYQVNAVTKEEVGEFGHEFLAESVQNTKHFIRKYVQSILIFSEKMHTLTGKIIKYHKYIILEYRGGRATKEELEEAVESLSTALDEVITLAREELGLDRLEEFTIKGFESGVIDKLSNIINEKIHEK